MDQLRIDDVEARRVSIPLKPPGFKWPHLWERRKSIDFTLVKITTGEGLIGYGMGSYPGPQARILLAEEIASPFRIEPLFHRVFDKICHPWGGPDCWSGVEIALWDLIGKAARQPVYKLLGGYKDKVKAYLSTIEIKKPEDHARDAVNALEKGWRAIKLRAHRMNPEEDLQTVKAVRDAIGDEMEIMVDANQARLDFMPPRWSFMTALKMARALDRLDVVWMEEPLDKDNWDGLRKLCEECDMYIAGAECNEPSLQIMNKMLAQGAFDIIQPDVIGSGIWNVRKLAILAEAWGRLLVPHSGWGLNIAASLQVVGASPNSPYVEMLYEPPIVVEEVRDTGLTEPLIVDREGYVKIPDKPGLGVEIDEGTLKKYTIEKL